MARQLDLTTLLAGDARLLNTYAVIHPPGSRLADAFAEWMAEGAGRDVIAGYTIEGRAAFTVWPRSCPGAAPTAPPCGAGE
jgi:ABC-type tungstate transport system permease subunit